MLGSWSDSLSFDWSSLLWYQFHHYWFYGIWCYWYSSSTPWWGYHYPRYCYSFFDACLKPGSLDTCIHIILFTVLSWRPFPQYTVATIFLFVFILAWGFLGGLGAIVRACGWFDPGFFTFYDILQPFYLVNPLMKQMGFKDWL